MPRPRSFLPILPLLFHTLYAGGSPTPEDTIRGVVQKSLPYIDKRGQSWKNSKGCHSCHRTTFTVWALNRATEKGLEVDPGKLAQWNEKGRQWQAFARKKKAKEMNDSDGEKLLQGENSAVSQMLLGRPLGEDPGKAAWIAQYRKSLLSAQEKNGSWKAKGQLPKQKRPLRETTEANTFWAVLALADYEDGNPATETSIKKALDWAGKSPGGISTEWWSTKLLVERQLGKKAKADALRKTLLEKQNPDGGWGWLTEESSDALGTGFALYALGNDDVPISDPRIKKSIQFLASNQTKDGSWIVNGTKEDDRDEPAETARYWGTCWAAIGMLAFVESGGSTL